MNIRLSPALRTLLPHRLLALGAVLALMLSACVTQGHLEPTGGTLRHEGQAVVLLMPPDVELSELTVGGLVEPNAEWTAQGLSNVNQALADRMRRRKAAMIPYDAPVGDAGRAHDHQQIMKLHRAVGVSIIQHKYFEPLVLPTKKDVFDWGLGPDVQMLREEYNAQYALFVYLRDSYSSPGRVAMMVAMTVFGYGMPGGAQTGFASLVDLGSGEVVWFNLLLRTTGDLRSPEPAREAIDALLAGFPL
ncbi:MAG: hypothetical protein GWN21_11895 [Gammaproteobacteria bacterium]|nr:hypothetical protein [Gammaproteobacteria bacterium]NIP89119.1 hypothetical protein [Gammaproteobacteria bacterium]NIR23978.1 hypothetical protein [Gammaproteobacteria bacterium]NIS05613.1 hypothetical protein [Gammaproteobacteria bacterium]NIU40927.1 hypothetical protein [Gammaproteobacteria bacterium]